MSDAMRLTLCLPVLLVAGCAGASVPAGRESTPASVSAALASQKPTTLADMQHATTLDIGLYRPQMELAGCGPRTLPAAQPDVQLASAIATAQTYSDSVSGIALGVMHDGKLVYEHYGRGTDASTQTVTASMAKSVLALMVGIAMDKGMIGGVDDPLGKYLPEWANDPRGKITLREALQMRPGLAKSDFQTVLLAPDIDAAALATPLEHAPGTVFQYDNAVPQIVSIVVDRQARKFGFAGYADFLEKDLWCPLGNGPAALWVDSKGHPRGYAGLHASLRDWLRIGQLILDRGKVGGRQIVPASWIAAMSTPSPVNPQYGYLVWLGDAWTPQRHYAANNPLTVPQKEPFVAKDTVFFDGFGGQRVYVIPSRKLVIARTGLVDMKYDDVVIPNAIVRGLDQPNP